MSMLKNLSLTLFLVSIPATYTLADTVASIKIINNTLGTLKLKDHGGFEAPLTGPLTQFNIGPGTEEVLDIPYQRTFTYQKPGWQPTRATVALVSNFIDYEVNGYRCRLKTLMDAPVVFGASEPAYKPDWQQTSSGRGTPGYSCSSYIAERQSTAPFSYTVVLTFNQQGDWRAGK